jgi:PAS domain S-box-containing protein
LWIDALIRERVPILSTWDYDPADALQGRIMMGKLSIHDPREESIVDMWLFIIVNTTILALLINILSITYGTTDVAAHLIYVPIVIAAYWYPNRGMVAAFMISAVYFAIVYVLTAGAPMELVAAMIRCVVFVAVAAVVSTLAIHMQKSEMKYRGIFDNSEAGTSLISRKDLTIAESNHRFASILGYSPIELENISFADLWADPNDLDNFFSALDKTRRITTMETRLRSKTSEIRWVLLSAGFLPDNQFVCAIVDITERKKAAESLVIRDHAIRSSINAVAMFDLNYRITFVNQSLLKTMGSVNEGEFIGRNLKDYFESGKKFDEVSSTVAEKGSWFGEVILIKSDKTPFFVMFWANTVKDENGKLICIMTSFIDITERKQMEMAQRRALEQIEKNIEQFAILGDHIRNPLTVIVGLASIAAVEISERIIFQAKEIDKIITRLDTGWIESEKVRDFIKRYYNVGAAEIETYRSSVIAKAGGGEEQQR